MQPAAGLVDAAELDGLVHQPESREELEVLRCGVKSGASFGEASSRKRTGAG